MLLPIGVRLDDLLLDLLHQIQKLIEVDASVAVRVNVLNELADFVCIALEAAHDGLKVFDFDVAFFFLVKEVKDLSEVRDFLVGKAAKALLGLRLKLIFIVLRLIHVQLGRESWLILIGVIYLVVAFLAFVVIVFMCVFIGRNFELFALFGVVVS